MFCGVGQKLSPLDSNVSSSLVRGKVERFRTVLVSSGCVFCFERVFLLARLVNDDGDGDDGDDDVDECSDGDVSGGEGDNDGGAGSGESDVDDAELDNDVGNGRVLE